MLKFRTLKKPRLRHPAGIVCLESATPGWAVPKIRELRSPWNFANYVGFETLLTETYGHTYWGNWHGQQVVAG